MPTPLSITQRQSIIDLLSDGPGNQEIATKLDVTPGQVAAVKAHVSMGNYGEAGGLTEATAEVADAVDDAFGLERDLQMALRRNIEHLEH